MQNHGEESRAFFAEKRRRERFIFLAVLGTIGAMGIASEIGHGWLNPYIFTIGCISGFGVFIAAAIDDAVRRARQP